MSNSPYTAIARLLRPQGRKGELLADLLTDFPERFETTSSVLLENAAGEPTPATVEGHWFPVGRNAGRVVLKLSGIDSINDAETLQGKLVLVPDTERVALAEDRVWIADLIGCELYHHDHPIGTIVDVQGSESPHGASLLIVKKRESDDELLIPFVQAYIQSLDLDAKRIEMNLPDGLLEING